MINHQNWGYSSGTPLSVGDRYYAQDLGRDFYYQQDSIGSAILAINNVAQGTPTLLKMASVTVDGTTPNTTLDVPLGAAVLPFTATLPDSYASLPPTTKTATVNLFLNWSAFTIDVSTLGCTGVATYKLYATYTETIQATRARAKAAGTYGYEITPTLTLGATTGAIPAGSVLLCTFTYNSGSSPITSVSTVNPTIIGRSVISLTSGSPYTLVYGSCDVLEINATTNPFIVNLPKAVGAGWCPKIVNTSALATGLVKIVPYSGDKIGPLGANVAAYLQNVDQSGWAYAQQQLSIIDSMSGQWPIAGGQFMPEPGSVDAAGSQYFLGRLRHLPLGNVTTRYPGTVGIGTLNTWTSAQQITGLYGVPSGAKGVRVFAFVQPIASSPGAAQIALAFSDNTSNTPTMFTAHPKIVWEDVAVTTGDTFQSGSEIDIPLNSSGQFYMYKFNGARVDTVSLWTFVVLGYYMGD